MLTDRFAFLSLVPQAVLAEHLLDMPLVRVRATLTRTKADDLVFELLPQADASEILHRLRGHKVPYMEVGRSYCVEVDETRVVSSSIDGEEMREVPAPIDFLLNHSYVQLRDLARQYAKELESLPSVGPSRECMRGNAVNYLDFLRSTDSFSRAFGHPPRVRSVCLGCFKRELGEPIHLQEAQVENSWQFVTTSIKGSPRLFHALRVCMGEPISPDVMPIFVLTPHEKLVFSRAYYRLYEAGMHRCLEEVYANERDVFVGKQLLAGHEDIES